MPATLAPRRPAGSWPDAVISLVDRLPGAPWLTYALVTLVAISVFVGQRLVDGIEINPVTVGYIELTVLPLAGMHYANRSAARALDDFRPALGELEPEYDTLPLPAPAHTFTSRLWEWPTADQSLVPALCREGAR